ncbi:MAG: hypothetical protein N2652_06330 [Kiritimatiellae bacterium]|nr:hypothetical protein [Kiritimatiellia bacterium]
MSATTNLTVAMIATLVTHLQQARQAIEAGRHADAIAPLTAVIEHSPSIRELTWAARWYRAQAHQAAGRAADARADLQWLATRDVPPPIRQAAREAFLAAGGTPRDLAPRTTPVEEWQRVQAWIAAGQPQQILEVLTADAATQFRTMVEDLHGEQGTEALAEWFNQEDAVLTSQRVDHPGGVAELTFRQDDMLFTVVWRQDGDRWKIAALKSRRAEEEPGPTAEVAVTNHTAALPTSEIAELVAKLAAEDPAIRARSRAQLRKLGPAERAALREYRNHPDPEVAETIRELLEER